MSTPVTSSKWASPVLSVAYYSIGKLREELAQHPESGIDAALRNALDAIESADVELEPTPA